MAYATVVDVQKRMGRTLNPAEEELVATLLDDVEIIIKAKLPDLEARIAASVTNIDVLIVVECAAVKRVILNSEGYLQETDGNYAYTRDSAVASGLLSITSHEWALLGTNAGMFTIQPEWYDDGYPPYGPFGSVNAQWFGPPAWQYLTRPI